MNLFKNNFTLYVYIGKNNFVLLIFEFFSKKKGETKVSPQKYNFFTFYAFLLFSAADTLL